MCIRDRLYTGYELHPSVFERLDAKTVPQLGNVEPLEYISVKLEDPYLDKPINAALFHREDGADLVWSRPKPKLEN